MWDKEGKAASTAPWAVEISGQLCGLLAGSQGAANKIPRMTGKSAPGFDMASHVCV